jgi:cardiolipin synthase
MAAKSSNASHWDRAQLYTDSQAYFERLLACIDAARECVDFEFYIFELDSLGRRFVEALGRAARRGVRVRVMMDGVGSMEDWEALSTQMHALGVEVRIYHPLPWYLGAYRWTRRPRGILAKFLTLLRKVNRRNHRKLCTVDRRMAWVGSLNITTDHLPESAGGLGWRDYGLELEGPRVQTLVDGFDDLWAGHKGRLRRGFLSGYLSNRSLKARQLKNRFVARSVANARCRVWLVSAYFLPTASLRRALLHACRAGVDVQLVLPEHSDVWVFPGLSSHYYRDLLRAGARIFLYQPGVLHAKALLVDDLAILGSSNWNYRSSLHDLELDVVLRETGFLASLAAVIEEDCIDSRELRLADTPVPGVLSSILYRLRYLM